VLSSYGLHGYSEPLPVILEMCPSVRQSCCTKRDQLDIYANWIHSKESHEVKHHYFEVTTVYTRLLEAFIKVLGMAKKIEEKLKHKNIANCKVMAQRIQVFQVDKLLPKLKINFRKMEDFFYDTYTGFYCAICNYENHAFINESTNSIQYSEKFCRDITENALASLLFLHSHLNRYANLVSKFLLSCDHKGDYQIDVQIPKKYLFVGDEKIEHELYGCRNERNTPGWFVYCRPVCEEFQIAKFAEFFEPEVQKLKEYTVFLEEKVAEMTHGGKERVLFNNIIKEEAEVKKGRLLSTAPVKDSGVEKKKERKLFDKDHTNQQKDKSKEGLIFKSGLESKIQLDHFKSIFGTEGISLYDDGRNSLFSAAMYNQIKTLLHLEHVHASSSKQVEDQNETQTKTNALGTFASVKSLVIASSALLVMVL
jgi:hypothetical protein